MQMFFYFWMAIS